MNAFLKPLV